jgi:ethanolamine utilization microcompartment shell protein EutL
VLSLEITAVYREIRRIGRSRNITYGGRILAVLGTNHADNVRFALTVQECVKFIDFGCDVFVTDDAGRRVAVHVVSRGPRSHIATAPDASGGNNLHWLST